MSRERFSRFFADLLTYSRFIAAFFVWKSLGDSSSHAEMNALIFFLLGALSDFFDGRLARLAGGHSSFGRIADPLADKALTLAAFAGLASRGVVGWWLFWVVLTRDMIITTARFLVPASSERAAARESGKWKTVFQMFFILAGLFLLAFKSELLTNPIVQNGLRLTAVLIAALTIWSGIRYLFAQPKKFSISKGTGVEGRLR